MGSESGDARMAELIDLEVESLLASAGSSKAHSISVEQYHEDLTLQLAILASFRSDTSSSSPPPHSIIDIDLSDGDDVVVVSENVVDPSSSRKQGASKLRSRAQIGGSSSSPRNSLAHSFMCEICFDPKPLTESFSVMGCVHAYCKECMSRYVAAKLQDSVPHIGCPFTGCHGILEPHYCREILPIEVFERWGNILCENLIAASEKFYCPFKDCSALLINDDGGGGAVERQTVITQSECPHCNRLFCAQCKCPWHAGIECSEFQKLNEGEREAGDIMLMSLAKDKNWRRCPKCKMFVEKSVGCMYMRCRCSVAFCYNCGAVSTSNTHICSKCGH